MSKYQFREVTKMIIVAAALVFPSTGNAQFVRFNWYPQPCANGQCNRTTQSLKEEAKSTADAPVSAEVTIEKFDNVSSTSEEVVTSDVSDQKEPLESEQESESSAVLSGGVFCGEDAEKWQIALESVCEQRGIPLTTIYERLGGRTINCTSSSYGSYAGCTWGADGSVSKVDIVPSNCYDVESVRRHEAAHVVTFLIDGASSLFVHEGVSQICERGGKRRTYLSKAARQMNDSTNFVDWVDVNSYDSAYRVYTFSFAVFEYLREAGGSKWLECFVNEAADTSFTSALYRWYRLSPEELNLNVRKLVEQDVVLPLF